MCPASVHPPRVLLPSCIRELDRRAFHAVGEAYTSALRLVGCQPLLVPGVAAGELDSLLDLADGIVLPGSPNNVHPCHFDEDVLDASLPLDPTRDELTLPMIRAAVARGIPLLGICRGHQEINVALGGSLHQAIRRIPGFDNHEPGANGPPEVKYAPCHDVSITPGGVLENILGCPSARVNSVHGQGVHRLAPGLSVEAVAPDGVIEAITLPGAPGFLLGLQWHPEWQAAGNPVSMAIFRAFADACRTYHARKPVSDEPP